MVIYMMFITETGMEKDSVYVILDIPKEMPKDCSILKNALVRK